MIDWRIGILPFKVRGDKGVLSGALELGGGQLPTPVRSCRPGVDYYYIKLGSGVS